MNQVDLLGDFTYKLKYIPEIKYNGRYKAKSNFNLMPFEHFLQL